jgi:hypothetical protein
MFPLTCPGDFEEPSRPLKKAPPLEKKYGKKPRKKL